MTMQDNYQCKKADISEIEKIWNEDIKKHSNNPLYITAKEEHLREIKRNTRITYIGLLKDDIICDITVIIKPEGIQKEAGNIEDIVNTKRAFLCGIKTNPQYENKGYFSKLFHFVEQELKKEGWKEISLAVEEGEKRTKSIYKHLGFNHYIGTEIKQGDGTIYTFHYYYKTI